MHGMDVCVLGAWMCHGVPVWCIFSPVWRNIRIREPVKLPNRDACPADVSDKGATVALFMAIIHTLVRAGTQHRVPPAVVPSRINRMLANKIPPPCLSPWYKSNTTRIRMLQRLPADLPVTVAVTGTQQVNQ